MKKTLLFLMIGGMWGSLFGQTSTPAKPNYKTMSLQQITKARYGVIEKANMPISKPFSGKRSRHSPGIEPNMPHLGSSYNVNSVRDASCTQTTANQACNLIVMTHRDDSSKFNLCGSGAYEPAFSTDTGRIWDTSLYIFCGAATRYPDGAIFNPAGNTNPSNCSVVMAGPYTDGSNWTAAGYGSISISDANPHGQIWTNGVNGAAFQDNGDLSFMSSSDDSTVHVIGEGWTLNGTTFETWLGAVLTTGKFNSVLDSFVFTQTVFRPHLDPSYAGATSSSPFDSMAFPLGEPGTAWSQDGKTGYVVIFGNLDSAGYNFVSYQPIVYKTTNSGGTWTMMTPFNFATLPGLVVNLQPTIDSAGYKTPLWRLFESTQGDEDDYDLTVDMNGNLHIFGVVIGSAYANADSAFEISYTLYGPGGPAPTGYIYDVYTNSSGGWNSRYIDSMQTLPCAFEEGYTPDWSVSGTNSVAFGARLQASRTTDGSKVFCTWEDDVTGLVLDSIVAPDVFGQGYDVNTTFSTNVFQFTKSEENYFLCVSDIVLELGTSPVKYQIPCTIAYPQSAPQTPCYGADGEPINYYYLDSVFYTDLDFTGIPPVTSAGFYISPNYPNPFNNITNFNITLTSESEVSVDVYNIVGEKVGSIAPQKMANGTHVMTINGTGWNPGVYFYKVTCNNHTLTQKMVVQ